MIDVQTTAYNLAIEAFKKSSFVELYDPLTLSATLVVHVDEDDTSVPEENRGQLFATHLDPSQNPVAVAEAMRRGEGSVILVDGSEVKDLLDRGALGMYSDTLSYLVTVALPPSGNFNGQPAGIAISDTRGSQLFPILFATPDVVNNSRLHPETTQLVAFQ